MDIALLRAIEELRGLSSASLKRKYREIVGEESPSWHNQCPFRRIVWHLQAKTEGGLSERARLRAAQIADDADLRLGGPNGHWSWPGERRAHANASSSRQRDARLPEPGTVLTRRYQGREIVVKLLANGFEYQSRQYRSLSAIAREVTGTQWNGMLFFGLVGWRHE